MPAAKSKKPAKPAAKRGKYRKKVKPKERVIDVRRKRLMQEALRNQLILGDSFKPSSSYSVILKRSLENLIGRPKAFDSPAELAAACLTYFQWNERSPLLEAKLVTYMGYSTLEQVPKLRAMTIDMLCVFIGISSDTWKEYRTKENFSAICRQVERAIRSQKLEGAAADLLNASIVSMEMGMRDKREGGQGQGDNDEPPESIRPVFNVRPAVAPVKITIGEGTKQKKL